VLRIDKEVEIEAPVERIFDYISDPRNLPEFWSSLMEIKDVQSLPSGGYSARWVYKMAGKRFEGKGEYNKVVPNRFFVVETKGGISSRITWTTRSRENMTNMTRVTLTIEYKVPIPLLGKLAEVIVRKMNEQEADLIMANLQTIFMDAKPPNALSRMLLQVRK